MVYCGSRKYEALILLGMSKRNLWAGDFMNYIESSIYLGYL